MRFFPSAADKRARICHARIRERGGRVNEREIEQEKAIMATLWTASINLAEVLLFAEGWGSKGERA